ENSAGLDVDEQGVVAVAHPSITVRRVDQSECQCVFQPIFTAPEYDRQGLAVDPTLGVPAPRLHVRSPVIAAFGLPVHLVGARIEVPAILLPLRRAGARLICGPIVTMALLVLLLLLLRWL